MTTLIGLLLSVSLLSAPRMNAVHGNQLSSPQVERVATDEMTFGVQNSTNVSVGMVAVQTSDGDNTKILVNGSGYFSGTISATVISVTIDGQPCIANQPTWIQVNENTAVRATWTGNIVVVDQDETI